MQVASQSFIFHLTVHVFAPCVTLFNCIDWQFCCTKISLRRRFFLWLTWPVWSVVPPSSSHFLQAFVVDWPYMRGGQQQLVRSQPQARRPLMISFRSGLLLANLRPISFCWINLVFRQTIHFRFGLKNCTQQKLSLSSLFFFQNASCAANYKWLSHLSSRDALFLPACASVCI